MASLEENKTHCSKYTQSNPVDIAIVGAGPAGLTATIYALRDNKSIILFEKEEIGGQILNTSKVTNIPGFAEISGFEFIENVKEQIESIQSGDLSFVNEEVIDVSPCFLTENYDYTEKNKGFKIQTVNGTYYSRTIIASTGSKYRTLGVLGEEELIGDGISFCSTCDAPFYKNKCVAIIGGGNSALTEALELEKFASKVYILQDLPYLTAENSLKELILSKEKIVVTTDVKINTFMKLNHFYGNNAGIAINMTDKKTNSPHTLVVDGVFEAIGMVPQNKCFSKIAILSETMADGYIVSMDDGAIGAGDCILKKVRQVATACGDGANAAVTICKLLEEGALK